MRRRWPPLGDSTASMAERLRSGVVEDSLADVHLAILILLLVLTLWTAVPAVGALVLGRLAATRARGRDDLTPGQASSCRSAERAAYRPPIPCTPPPGGVDDEHRYSPSPTR